METKYDYLIIGAGLFGSVFARQAKDRGKKVLVAERRKQIGGNLYCEKMNGITVHKYGAHIFHTSNKTVWEYVNRYISFSDYKHTVVAKNGGDIFDLPFNLHTFYQVYGIHTPHDVEYLLCNISRESSYRNLEEKAISMVGKPMYEKLIKGYTEKQWGCKCTELPPEIIGRLPVRFTFDNSYFNDIYQGIPESKDGYNKLIENLLKEIEVITNVDFGGRYDPLTKYADKIICTGSIDEYFQYCYGHLPYRSLRFHTDVLECKNYQGAAVVNYTGKEVPYTRIIEHKHFVPKFKSNETVLTYEYPEKWEKRLERYYPIGTNENKQLYNKYRQLAIKEEPNVVFGGRLGMYKYMDMDDTIEAALALAEKELKGGETVNESRKR